MSGNIKILEHKHKLNYT